MHQPTIIIPFALLPTEHAKDLLAVLHAPALAQLLSHAYRVRHSPTDATGAFDAFAALLPHEQWLTGGNTDNSPSIAHLLMQQLGLQAEPGYWFVIEPAHFHIARDHLVLTDRRQLAISESESQTIFEAALPLFTELGYTLRFGDARHWFLRADAWSNLRTCSPDTACGHNIDVWLPRGPNERDWRRLHNEVQMLWHTHAINDAREQRGERRINALWLWGGSGAVADAKGLQELARCSLGLPAPQISQNSGKLLLDPLISAALAGDWSAWLAAIAELDARYLTTALTQLKQGQINRLHLVLTDSTQAIEWRLGRLSMRKFWVRASLARLVP